MPVTSMAREADLMQIHQTAIPRIHRKRPFVVYSAHDTPKLPTPTFTQAFLAHRNSLRQNAVLITTRLYVPEVHFSAVTILPYVMLSNMENLRLQKNPPRNFP